MRKLLTGLILSLGLAGFAQAQSDDGLLPVEQAFKLTTRAAEPGKIALHWEIAKDYYLYRSRIKTKTTQAGLTLGALELPAGKQKNDEFLGEVEIYHDSVDATLPYSLADAATKTLSLTVNVQGCHEVDPKICYPPHTTTVTLDVPAGGATAAAAPASAGSDTGLKNGATQPLIALGGAPGLGGAADRTPLPPEQAFVFEAIAASPTSLLTRWTMPKGYYLYRDKSSVMLSSGDGVRIGAPQWSPGVPHRDEHFGEVVVYFDQVELPLALARERGAAQTIKVHAEYQGCQDDGICYPVMTRDVDVDLPAATPQELEAAKASFVPAAAQSSPDTDTQATAASGKDGSAGEQSEEQALAANLSSNRLLALLSFFGFGLLLAFTPCVFPMVPILSGIIAGSGENVSTRRAFVLSLVYVLATCVVFTIAGIVAGLAGANLQAAFQKPWILWSFAGLFVLLALSMFGFYELQLPSSLQTKLADISNRQKGGSLIGVAIMGLLSALIVGPCVAPPLAAAVLYISQTRDPVFGGLALFVLSLGMGAPLVVFGTAAGRFLPRAGAWMNAVKAVFGVLFLGLAIWMLSRILDGVWIMLMSGAVLIGSAVYLGALERLPDGASGWSRLWKALGVILLLLGAAELIGAAAGGRDVLKPLGGIVASAGKESAGGELKFRKIKTIADLDREVAAAAQGGRRVMLDFYADWCVSCKEMEKFTFTQPAVQKSLADFVLLKADVTANDEADQALLKRFALFGPPATIFFADGAERRPLRLIGFESADDFVARVGKVQ
ncbi:protein-disulfide reductase DsbD [Dokdonella sp.]|uniref:protein-disulfide reductase DsbD n=1 Tax=Dokdonella sp. TaxID=2291710 RepID=UPI001B1EA985|nr:protein-disulfide reductase DsbD [Dokdonella sp.]MBO9664355.1 protein-disulfide reductase DsbD [Dokdonella sp.]